MNHRHHRHERGDHVWILPVGDPDQRLRGVIDRVGKRQDGRFDGSYLISVDDGACYYNALGSEVKARPASWILILNDMLFPET